MKFNQRKNFWRAPQNTQYSAVFAGDICPRHNEKQIIEGASAQIFAEVKPFFQSADLRFVQWETVLGSLNTPIDKSGPNLQVDARCVAIAQELNVDVALLANNHIGDFGPQGVLNTIDCLHQAGIRTVGAGTDLDDARKVLIVPCGGLKIAVLNLAENEFGGARDQRPGVGSMPSPLKMVELVKDAKKLGDLLFVVLHGGHEYNPYPSPRMVELFRALIDAGADLLWNCHTHCPEAAELYHDKPIIYSPGNFYFPAGNPDYPPIWDGGYLTKFYFDAQGVYGVELAPYIQRAAGVKFLTPEQEAKFFQHMEKLNAPLDDPAALQRFFEIWCAGSGLNYLSSFQRFDFPGDWPPDWRNCDNVKKALPTRNLYTCESHNDLLRQTLRLIEEFRITERREQRGEIEPMYRPDWID